MTISTDRMEKALRYLAETNEQYAILKALVEDYEYRIKIAEANVTKASKGLGTEGYIKSLTRTDPAYIKLVDELYGANIEYLIIGAKRHAEELIFKAWQSLNANARQGNII